MGTKIIRAPGPSQKKAVQPQYLLNLSRRDSRVPGRIVSERGRWFAKEKVHRPTPPPAMWVVAIIPARLVSAYRFTTCWKKEKKVQAA